MKRAFREAYNRELALLKERASEFALEYPGLADRLGGLLEENLDPTVAGLLEGSAFLAARVQLKLEEEFRTFTTEMLDQLYPDALEPTPSVMLVRARMPAERIGEPDPVQVEPGDYLDARFRDADKRVSCRFALAAPLDIWPLTISDARYHASPGPIGALGQEVTANTKSGMVIDIDRADETGAAVPVPLSDLPLDTLTVHLVGGMGDASRIYEQVFCDRVRVSLRWLNKQGDATFATLPPDAVQPVGFERDEKLFPHKKRVFEGFSRLREFFVFPRKFAGFRVSGLAAHLPRNPSSQVQLVFEFSRASPDLAARMKPEYFALNAAPAVNLFEEMSSTVRIDQKQYEYVVTPNSSPRTHYEFHAIQEVWAHYTGTQNKVQVHPLYSVPPDKEDPRRMLYYSARRKPRELSPTEKRSGTSRFRYRGTETYVSLYEPPGEEPVKRLQIKALCSNRHLAEYLPIAQAEEPFFLTTDQTVALTCVAGPTPPRLSLLDLDKNAGHRNQSGDVYWRLMSYLSLNQSGLSARDGGEAAAALREMLSLFADLSDNVNEASIGGIDAVETRPVTRTIAHDDGYHSARGIEITVTFDEDEYEAAGAVFLGSVLDRFFAEYAAINSFTQTVLRSVQRGHLKTFTPRSGSGPIL